MIKIRQNVRLGMLAALVCLCMFAPRLAAAAQEVVHVEFDGAAGIVDLQLLRDGNKIVSAFAFETGRNTPWLVKTDQLTVAADGRIAGTITLTQTPDLLALVNARRGNKDAKAAPPLTDEVTLDVVPQGGKLEGTVKPATAKTALLGKADPVAARGSMYSQIPATESLIELLPFGVNAKPLSLGNPIGGGLFLFMRVRAGKVERAKVNTADTSFEVSSAIGQPIVEGNTLKGAITLAKADKSPEEGIVRFEGTIIGDYAVGLATWESGGTTEQTGFRARVSRHQPFPSLQVADRTWEPNGKPLESDSVLAAKAKEESLQPIRPGEPGKQPFYSTRPIHLNKYFALHTPTIAFNEVPGAVKYRITALRQVRRDKGRLVWDEKGPGSVSCELEKPWMPLTPIWKEASVGPLHLIATGLDAVGKDIGQAEFPGKAYKYIGGNPLELEFWRIRSFRVQKDLKKEMPGPEGNLVPLTKMATFAGPYWAPNRTGKEGVLAAARWMRDSDAYMVFKNILVWGQGPGVSPAPASFTRACTLIAALSDNPEERREALALAERTAWMMYRLHRGKLPRVYGGDLGSSACLQVWYALAYLDVYAVGKDPRFRDAALDLAKAFAAVQDPESGAWPGRDKETGEKLWQGGVFGPCESRFTGGEAVLWFLGRLRKELGVDDFVQNEARANKWVQTDCLPEMFWQNVGHHSMEMVLVQDTVAPHALSYCTWLLDYADAKDKDLKLVTEIARWCEERHVNWQRQPDPTKTLETRPSCWGWTRAAGTGIRVAGSLVYVWTRLWQETKDPLWKAKADALVQSILVAQDPVDGGFSKGFFCKSTDYTGGTKSFSYNDYDAVDAAYRLMEYSRLTAAQP